jgi:hypothetical protein
LSISWGIRPNCNAKAIERALKKAVVKNVIILASASNEGALHPIKIPATMDRVFCIGSANGRGTKSQFNPPEWIRPVKFSAVGEGIVAAWTTVVNGEKDITRKKQNDGTSSATPVAAGIVALLFDYLRQFKSRSDETYDNVLKLFIKMSTTTSTKSYRFLVPCLVFVEAHEREIRKDVNQILACLVGINPSPKPD